MKRENSYSIYYVIRKRSKMTQMESNKVHLLNHLKYNFEMQAYLSIFIMLNSFTYFIGTY